MAAHGPHRNFTRIRTHVTLTCMDAQHTKHVTYKLAYHCVWCPCIRQKDSRWQAGYVDRTGNLSYLCISFASRSPECFTFTDRSHARRDGLREPARIPGIAHRHAFEARLPPAKQSVTGKSKPNKNAFVGQSPCNSGG